jgi:hypothetical protein
MIFHKKEEEWETRSTDKDLAKYTKLLLETRLTGE